MCVSEDIFHKGMHGLSSLAQPIEPAVVEENRVSQVQFKNLGTDQQNWELNLEYPVLSSTKWCLGTELSVH